MKRIISLILCCVCVISFFNIDVEATDSTQSEKTDSFYSVTFNAGDSARVTGLITSYSLGLTKSGTTLNIGGFTKCIVDVVKCGFKDLKIQRRKSSSYSWEDYYEYGNLYSEAVGANLSTTLVVEKGYQYRISCKHYAKKNFLMVETISNTSNVVTVS